MEVTGESVQQAYARSPVEGQLCALHENKHRPGGVPRQWLRTFLAERDLWASDRSSHEMSVVYKAVHVAGTYGQLNLGGAVMTEGVNERLSSMVDALSRAGMTT